MTINYAQIEQGLVIAVAVLSLVAPILHVARVDQTRAGRALLALSLDLVALFKAILDARRTVDVQPGETVQVASAHRGEPVHLSSIRPPGEPAAIRSDELIVDVSAVETPVDPPRQPRPPSPGERRS